MGKTIQMRKAVYSFVAVVLAVVSVAPALLLPQKAHAYSLPTNRGIKMSSSKQADTNVIYNLFFTTNQGGANVAVAGMVVQFCSNSPILGDSCTAPSSFNTNFATLALANQTNITGWSVDTTNSTANTLILTRSSSTVNTGTAFSIDLGTAANGITNPNTTNTTFYARVLTYDTAAHAQAYTATNLGTGSIDAGGIAFSTGNQITITAKVQERLTFCVYTGANCAAGGNTITLGDTNGVLDPTGPYVDKNTKYDVATNASSGVAIRVKGDTLKTGSLSINAIGGTATASALGTEQFGFCTYQSAGSGLTPQNLYDGDASGTTSTACTNTAQSAGTASTGGDNSAAFAFDTTNTNTTYGQTFADKVAGSTSTGVIAFLGNIANTTEAGIYTTTLTFIATGTY